ncbi:MAG: Hsp20/alpha crystallin family protein [Chloroflexi bacterium]|nr:Hsp20/alpha crystallin family protein [Chloroflexota bacterium]
MTFYVIPRGRVIRRRAWSRDDDFDTPESEVFVPVNVTGDADSYTITALLPGVKADDLSIQVLDETVTLQGEIKSEENGNVSYLLRERPTGKFYRAIRLAEPLNADACEATLTDGVLTLRVPKAEESRPRKIKINSVK